MTFLQIQSDSLEQLEKLPSVVHDSITIVISNLDKLNQSKSLLDNTGIFTVIGAFIATMTAIGVLFIKKRFEDKKSIQLKKENVFSDLTGICYKILLSRANVDLFSAEQEFYLAMTNSSQDKDAREVYLFMYKDNATKYALAIKEFTASFSEFNKVIADYVLITNDTDIANEINSEFSKVSHNIDFDFPSKDTEVLQQLRAKYHKDIDTSHQELTEKLDMYRQRVYKRLDLNL